jgi:hypothetical protein
MFAISATRAPCGRSIAVRLWAMALCVPFTMVQVACGASIQQALDGEARFEHCYAIEQLPDVSATDQSVCWKLWIDKYAATDTLDRVQYAKARRDVVYGPDHASAISGAPLSSAVRIAPSTKVSPPGAAPVGQSQSALRSAAP